MLSHSIQSDIIYYIINCAVAGIAAMDSLAASSPAGNYTGVSPQTSAGWSTTPPALQTILGTQGLTTAWGTGINVWYVGYPGICGSSQCYQVYFGNVPARLCDLLFAQISSDKAHVVNWGNAVGTYPNTPCPDNGTAQTISFEYSSNGNTT